jgi:REP element-mobilizing transposase RayT
MTVPMPGPAQIPLALKTKAWGGYRAGAGRKPSRESGASHLARPELSRHHPVHTTLRVAHGCWNLRSRRALLALQGAFEGGRNRFGFRLIHYSVQGNHVHLIVEASDKQSLSRGMQALTIRMARALNRMMQRRGSVFADRFHAHVLRSRREVAHALRYVFGNFAHHARTWGAQIRASFCDPFSSVAWFAAEVPEDAPVAAPGTWLLRVGWRGAD